MSQLSKIALVSLTLTLCSGPMSACEYSFTLIYDTLSSPTEFDYLQGFPALNNQGEIYFGVSGHTNELGTVHWLYRYTPEGALQVVEMGAGTTGNAPPARVTSTTDVTYTIRNLLNETVILRNGTQLPSSNDSPTHSAIGPDGTVVYTTFDGEVWQVAPGSTTSQVVITESTFSALGYDSSFGRYSERPSWTGDGNLWLRVDGYREPDANTHFSAVLRRQGGTTEKVLSTARFNYNTFQTGTPRLSPVTSFAENEYFLIDIPWYIISDSLFSMGPDGELHTLFGQQYIKEADGTYTPTEQQIYSQAQIFGAAANLSGDAVLDQSVGIGDRRELIAMVDGFMSKVLTAHSFAELADSLFGRTVQNIHVGPDAINDAGHFVFFVDFHNQGGDSEEGIVLATRLPSTDSDSDGVADGCDSCAGFDDHIDADGDRIPDDCDLCQGNNSYDDLDGDGVCADRDCDDDDPDAAVIDLCGICGGDNACVLFDDDFESGDTTAWS